MARNREIALQLIRDGKKDKALVAMKRRKMQEKLLEGIQEHWKLHRKFLFTQEIIFYIGTDEQVLTMEIPLYVFYTGNLF